MNILSVFALLLDLGILNALPTNAFIQPFESTDTMYNALVNNCPILNLDDTTFKSQTVLEKCNNWQEINGTKDLTHQTEQNVLCLLYYDTFIPLCEELKKLNVANPNTVVSHLVPNIKDYQIDKICKNLALLPTGKKFEHNIDKIINEEGICYKLCTNYDRTPVRECGLAYYFTNTISLLIQDVLAKNVKSTATGSREGQQALNISKAVVAPVASSSGGVQQAQQAPQVEIKAAQSQQKSDQAPSTEKKPLPNSEGKPVPNTEQKSKTVAETVKTGQQNVVSANTLKATLKETPDSKPDITSKNEKNPKSNDKNVSEQLPSAVKNKTERKPEGKTDNVKVISAKGTSEQNQEDNPVEELPKVDVKAETEITADQANSLVPPEQMIDENEDEEEGNNYKDEDENPPMVDAVPIEEAKQKPSTLTGAGELPSNYNTAEDLDGESYFFSYFMVICVLFVLGYVGYHNRQKVMALMVEGKRGKRQGRGRRPNSANYHKLDSNLEEAISSSCSKNSSNVIY